MITAHKSVGLLNGQHMMGSYEEGDFKYFIVEIGGSKIESNKYENNFCIIPEKELIKQGILKSKTCKGKQSIYICTPDAIIDHWAKPYWNNIPKEFIKTD
jgi:hypothetical protein